MTVPRTKFRDRPKKTGAKKKIRVKAQQQRLFAAGYTEDKVKIMNPGEIRAALRKTGN